MARYVIFTESLFTERDWERFGCDDFLAAGYEVLCVEVSRALGIGDRLLARGGFQSIEAAVAPEDPAALDRIVGSLVRDDVVLMQVLLTEDTRRFFRSLYQHEVRYAAVTMGPLPISRMRSFRSALSVGEYISLLVEDARSVAYRWKRVGRQMIAGGFSYFRLQSPSLWLAVGGRLPVIVTFWPRLWAARRISIASHDYATAKAMSHGVSGGQATAVFLDEAFPDHPDFAALGQRSPVARGKYWASLERFFQAVEAATGLAVVIARHPKSSSVPPEVNAARWTGKTTAELVRNSALVLCHCSTAISFAVVFRKPIIFVTTDQIEASGYRKYIARISSFFRHRRVNADRFVSSEIGVPPVGESVYQKYEDNYLRAPGAVSGSVWKTLRNEMKRQDER